MDFSGDAEKKIKIILAAAAVDLKKKKQKDVEELAQLRQKSGELVRDIMRRVAEKEMRPGDVEAERQQKP